MRLLGLLARGGSGRQTARHRPGSRRLGDRPYAGSCVRSPPRRRGTLPRVRAAATALRIPAARTPRLATRSRLHRSRGSSIVSIPEIDPPNGANRASKPAFKMASGRHRWRSVRERWAGETRLSSLFCQDSGGDDEAGRPHSRARSSFRRILPEIVFGSSATNSMRRGYLYGAVTDFTWS